MLKIVGWIAAGFAALVVIAFLSLAVWLKRTRPMLGTYDAATEHALRDADKKKADAFVAPDLGVLDRLRADDLELLIREFSGNPNWLVTVEDHVMTAYMRETTLDGPRAGFNNYIHVSGGVAASARMQIFFTDHFEPNVEWDVQSVDANAKSAKVIVRSDFDHPEADQSFLLFKGKAPFYVMIYEGSTGKSERVETQKLLTILRDEITAALKKRSEIMTNGAMRNVLLPRKFQLRELTTKCLETRCRTNFAVAATFNPMEPGKAFLRAQSNPPGKPVSILPGVSQIMGWSKNPSQLFLFDTASADFRVKGAAASIEVELWFRPDSEKPERKIASTLLTIHNQACDGEICEEYSEDNE